MNSLIGSSLLMRGTQYCEPLNGVIPDNSGSNTIKYTLIFSECKTACLTGIVGVACRLRSHSVLVRRGLQV